MTHDTEDDRHRLYTTLVNTALQMDAGVLEQPHINITTEQRPDVAGYASDADITEYARHIRVSIQFDRVASKPTVENVGTTLDSRDAVIHCAASEYYGVDLPKVGVYPTDDGDGDGDGDGDDAARLGYYDIVRDIDVRRRRDP